MPPTIARNSAKSKEEEARGKTAENSKKAKGSASKLMTLLLYASVWVCTHVLYVQGAGRWEVGPATFGAVAVAIHHTQSEIN